MSLIEYMYTYAYRLIKHIDKAICVHADIFKDIAMPVTRRHIKHIAMSLNTIVKNNNDNQTLSRTLQCPWIYLHTRITPYQGHRDVLQYIHTYAFRRIMDIVMSLNIYMHTHIALSSTSRCP